MKYANNRTKRILHVVSGMNQGGIETWLMHVLRHLDRDRYRFDFLTHTIKPCVYDDELREMNCKILPCLYPYRPLQYSKQFLRILKDHGPYDVVHSHVHHYSGFIMYLARKAHVQMRIAHSHSDTSQLEKDANIQRKLYLFLMERFIHQYATIGLACSKKAAKSLFCVNWEADKRWRILYCGIDLKPFANQVQLQARVQLGIPDDIFVVGHVGRFVTPKNHTFLLDIISCVIRQDSNVKVVLVGDGYLRNEIENKVKSLGLEKHIIFAGMLLNVPQIMLGAMNVFLLPSLYEGLGLVLVEAQAAGLPSVISDVIPEEADLVPSLITRLSLENSPEVWAQAIIERKQKGIEAQADALKIIKQSHFNIENSVSQLCAVYDDL